MEQKFLADEDIIRQQFLKKRPFRKDALVYLMARELGNRGQLSIDQMAEGLCVHPVAISIRLRLLRIFCRTIKLKLCRKSMETEDVLFLAPSRRLIESVDKIRKRARVDCQESLNAGPKKIIERRLLNSRHLFGDDNLYQTALELFSMGAASPRDLASRLGKPWPVVLQELDQIERILPKAKLCLRKYNKRTGTTLKPMREILILNL